MSAVGIDLGTATTVVCSARRGVLVDEPTAMLVRPDGRRRVTRPVAVGHDARDLVGRVPMDLSIVRPVQDGAVIDIAPVRTYLRSVLRGVVGRWERWRAPIALAVPLGATDLECRALLEAAEEVRLQRVTLVPAPVAGAVGCGVDPMDRRTHVVVDVGAGTAEIAAFAYGGVIAHRSSRLGGDEMTLAVHQYLRQAHQVIVGELVAEEVKLRSAVEEGPSIVVQGQDAATGRPRLVTISIEEVMEAVRPVTETIVATLSACLYDLPAQVMGDVTADGVTVFGGASLLRGFDKALEGALGFSVRPAERPLTCVAEGLAALLRQPSALHALARG